jgi:hypothetical protein
MVKHTRPLLIQSNTGVQGAWDKDAEGRKGESLLPGHGSSGVHEVPCASVRPSVRPSALCVPPSPDRAAVVPAGIPQASGRRPAMKFCLFLALCSSWPIQSIDVSSLLCVCLFAFFRLFALARRAWPVGQGAIAPKHHAANGRSKSSRDRDGAGTRASPSRGSGGKNAEIGFRRQDSRRQ